MFWAGTARRRDQMTRLASCMVSSVSSVALTTLVTLFATSTLTRSPIQTLALAAATLDILALAALLTFTLVQFWRSSRLLFWSQLQRLIILSTVIAPSIAAFILSIYVLAWMHNNRLPLELATHQRNTSSRLNAAIAMWVLSLIAQAAFYTLCLSQTASSSDTVITSSETGVFRVESSRKEVNPISMAVFPPPAYLRSLPESPTFSTHTASPMASVRNSMTSFLRPVTSRSRLVPVRGESFFKDAGSVTSEPPSDPVRQEDGFETWEVQAAATSTPPLSPAPCAQPPRLETIPGSRPVSPAHPLNGPFPLYSAPPEEIVLSSFPKLRPSLDTSTKPYHDMREDSAGHPISPSFYPSRSPSFVSSTENSPTTRTFTPPFAVTARRPSTSSNDQSHIHPLFRTDSPVPPPLASPGTILTASPYAGQILTPDCNEFPRGRKNSVFSRNDGSRPGSPASLRPGSTRSMSRPGSSKGATKFPTMLIRSYSQGDLKEAHRSASAMEERPPMPEPVFLAHRRQSSN